LGVAYLDGKFFTINKRQAKSYFNKACLLNNQSACEEYNKLDK
jgi:TPR repeat protein